MWDAGRDPPPCPQAEAHNTASSVPNVPNQEAENDVDYPERGEQQACRKTCMNQASTIGSQAQSQHSHSTVTAKSQHSHSTVTVKEV